MWTLRSSGISDPEHVVDDREDAVGRDDREHHRGRRGLADRGRVPPASHPAETTRKRDEDAEDDALSDPETDAREPDRVLGLHPVLCRRLREHAHGDGRTSQDADEIGVDAEERHHEAESGHAREHEEVHRGNDHDDERLDLLVDVHLSSNWMRGIPSGPSPPLSGHPSAGRPNAPRPYRGVAAPDVPDASLVAEVRAHRLTVLSTPSRRRRYGTHPTVTTSSLISATPSASWDFAVECSLAIVDPQPAVTDRRYVTAPAPILPCDATGAATVHRARRDPRRVDSGDLRSLDVRAGHETVPVEDVGVDALVIMLVVMDLAILSSTTTRLGPTATSNPRVASSWSSAAFVMRKSARPGSGTTRQPSCAGRQPCRSSAARLHRSGHRT